MFVIRRKAGESVRIGETIHVTVLEVSGSRVKLGFTAPAELAVVRHELLQAREQNVAAARSTPSGMDLQACASALLRRSGGPE
ncbi:MAG: carbon storage regulator [Acidobacteria bacterium]|nr:carbon storage regulator [Acidobacteriota bacterium]